MRWKYLDVLIMVGLACALALSSACDEEKEECRTSRDCPEGQRCVKKQCKAFDDETCEGDIPAIGDLVLNEILTAPRTDDDTNCDGAMSTTHDEFIEIVNTSDRVLSVRGVEIQVGDNSKHTLTGCIEPGRGIVVYGGGTAMCDFGETRAFVARTSFQMPNSGGRVALVLGTEILDMVETPSLSGTSYTRSPDFTGNWVRHSDIVPERFSVGLCASGDELKLGCKPPSGCNDGIQNGDETDIDCGGGTCAPCDSGKKCIAASDCMSGDCDTAQGICVGTACSAVPSIGVLRINEVHSAPKSGEDDTNCDGTMNTTQDEFIEIVNNGTESLLLSGVEIWVNENVKHTLSGCLPPERGIVVYGGGQAMCNLGSTQAVVSQRAFQIANAGAEVSLRLSGATIDRVEVPALSGVSYTRFPDFTGEVFFKHNEVSQDRFSVGRCVSGDGLRKGCALPPGCNDGIQNGTETDVDCGGSCPPCGQGKMCELPGDCQSGQCDADTYLCVGAACEVVPQEGDLRVNEVHSAPMANVDDTNCDGIYSTTHDEFIEIVNVTGESLSLDGVELRVKGALKHTFQGCLPAGRGMVVYGGGEAKCNLGGTLAVVADASLVLANTGTEVTLERNGDLLDGVVVPSLSGVSFTRVPDFVGDTFMKHTDVTDERYSVGRCASGDELRLGCAPPPGCNDGVQNGDETDVDCGGSCAPCETGQNCEIPNDCLSGQCDGNVCVGMACTDEPVEGELLVNEVHPAPATGDDTNCDGTYNFLQDEFVEIVNNTDKSLLLSNVQVKINGVSKTTLAGCLAPNRGMVIYGGGTANCSLGDTRAVVSAASFSMTNTTQNVVSLERGTLVLDTVAVPSMDSSRSSYTRFPDFTGEWVAHDSIVPERYSAGRCVSGASLAKGCPAPPTCNDGIQNGFETDVDCGGGVCPACLTGEKCEENTDCQSGTCDPVTKRCTGPACETVPASGVLRINEVHPALQVGDDTNCDGTYSATADEFIEIVNNSNLPLLLNGVEVRVNGTVRATLSGCLAPERGMVIYGGGTAMCNLGDTRAVVASSSFSMTNTAANEVRLELAGATLDQVTVPSMDSSRASYTRFPDFTGEWVQHNTIVAERYSVGRCVSGAALSKGCAAPPSCFDQIKNGDETDVDCGGPLCGPCGLGDDCLVNTDCQSGTCDSGTQTCVGPACSTVPGAGDFRVNEVFPAPATTDDTNCSGAYHADHDEYVEVVNTTTADLLLTGVQLQVGGDTKHVFSGCLPAGRGMIIYGRGASTNPAPAPACDYLGTTALLSSEKNLGLVNGSTNVVRLQTSAGVALDEVEVPRLDQTQRSSYTRSPDFTGSFIKHNELGDPANRYSAGRCTNGAALVLGGCP